MQHLRSQMQTQLLIAYWVAAFIGWQVEIYSWERIDFLNFENKHFKLPVALLKPEVHLRIILEQINPVS